MDGSLQGLHLHGLQLTASHNQFMDDTMLLNSPISQEAIKINNILNDFSESSDTSFNRDKSHLFFFNTPPTIQLHISHLLEIPIFSLPSHYLVSPFQILQPKISPRTPFSSPSPIVSATGPSDPSTSQLDLSS
jgi:hypothetical protein